MEVGDIVQVRAYCSLEAQTAINVRHYRTTAKAGTGATPAQLASTLATALGPLYKALMDSDALFRGIDCQVILPVLGFPEFSTTMAGAGDNVGDTLPKQVCGLISFVTNLGGRANRGRLYVPFPCEIDNQADSTPSAGYKVELNNLGGAWSIPRVGVGGGGNTNSFQPVIFHRGTGLTTDITTFVNRPKWATQRRRGDFGRPNPVPVWA